MDYKKLIEEIIRYENKVFEDSEFYETLAEIDDDCDKSAEFEKCLSSMGYYCFYSVKEHCYQFV